MLAAILPAWRAVRLDVLRAIELLGTEVAPKVREALATQAANR